ncbi:RING-H2 finger protein ATL52-like [Phoenix dactylifera]|uniref:RING-type E3 ubiquitin transferase n=1 Tax=Phoenix dactylifera TaxID=42345 RepID=A0A8B7CT92_PHODC|nr:RING-H2 finger protein ATL52-like [Phoenix dactylifera]
MDLHRRILLPGDDDRPRDPAPPSPSAHRNLIIIVVSVIAAVIFLSLVYYSFLRRRWRLRHLLLPPAAVPAGSGAASPPSDDDGAAEDGEGPHHVWYIRTVGLDEATIGSIAVAEYKAGGGLLGAADCSVCLGDFQDGELVRLLPKCGHAFHVPCIDTWLRAHVNCPLCRAGIIDPAADLAGAAPPPPAATTVGAVSVDDSSSSVPVDNPDTGIQALESDNGLQDVEEEDRGTESGVEIGILTDQLLESSELAVPSELGEDGLQPVRRSVSMDSPYLGILPIRVEPEKNSAEEQKDPYFGEEQTSNNRGKQGNSSKQGSLRKGHLEIERSLSSSGRGFFSRYGRVARNSILPS